MAWSYTKPSRSPIYIIVRGTYKLCGYKYIWDTPTIVEQLEPSDTITHTHWLPSLLGQSTIYYYLWAPGGPYGLEIQGPLITVRLPLEMTPSARVYRDTTQAIPNGIWTPISFNQERWDTDNIWVLTSPTRLTCRTAGLYHITGHVGFAANNNGWRQIEVVLNALTSWGPQGGPPKTTYWTILTTTTQLYLQIGDYIELQVFQDSGGALNALHVLNQLPEFMMTKTAEPL